MTIPGRLPQQSITPEAGALPLRGAGELFTSAAYGRKGDSLHLHEQPLDGGSLGKGGGTFLEAGAAVLAHNHHVALFQGPQKKQRDSSTTSVAPEGLRPLRILVWKP